MEEVWLIQMRAGDGSVAVADTLESAKIEAERLYNNRIGLRWKKTSGAYVSATIPCADGEWSREEIILSPRSVHTATRHPRRVLEGRR